MAKAAVRPIAVIAALLFFTLHVSDSDALQTTSSNHGLNSAIRRNLDQHSLLLDGNSRSAPALLIWRKSHTRQLLSVRGGGGVGGAGCRTVSNSGGSASIITALRAGGGGESNNKTEHPLKPAVDFGAIFKYVIGLTAQTSLIYAFLAICIDKLLVSTLLKGRLGLQSIPIWANFLFFYVFNLMTSLFSILPINKQRGDLAKRNKPWWTPPGYVFAIMWPLFVFGIRAFTASRVVGVLGGIYANKAVMALMFHLCVASLWNTINNVERRLGVSVIVLYLMWLSKAYAAYEFWRIDKISGQLLAATLTWLTAAAALETNTWLINPDSDTGKVEPLYPAKVEGKWKTAFRWER